MPQMFPIPMTLLLLMMAGLCIMCLIRMFWTSLTLVDNFSSQKVSFNMNFKQEW